MDSDFTVLEPLLRLGQTAVLAVALPRFHGCLLLIRTWKKAIRWNYLSADDNDVKAVVINQLFADVFTKIADGCQCNNVTRP